MLIPLTQGFFAEIDDEDYDIVKNYSWSVFISITGKPYAKSHIRIAGKQKTIYMSRLIMDVRKASSQIDHIDCNGLNNKRSNLRIVDNNQNAMNKPLFKCNKTGFKGVHFHKRDLVYQANIRVNNKLIYLGYFDNAIDAAKAYNKASLEYHGEYGKLNQIPEEV